MTDQMESPSTEDDPPLPPNSSIPAQPKYSANNDRQGGRKMEPCVPCIGNSRNHQPPRVIRKTLSSAFGRRQVADFPQPIHSSEDQPDGSGIDAAQEANDRSSLPQRTPEALDCNGQSNARDKDTQPAKEGAKDSVERGMLQRESAQEDCKVEVGSWEGLNDGETDQEVTAGNPAWADDVRAEERDNNWASAEDDSSCKVHAGENIQRERRRRQLAPCDKDCNERGYKH